MLNKVRFSGIVQPVQRAAVLVPAVLLSTFVWQANAVAAGSNGVSILNRMRTIYSNAQSYQGQFDVTRGSVGSNGKPASLTAHWTVAYQRPNRFFVKAVVTGTGTQAAGASRRNNIAVCDGRVAYQYSQFQNRFVRQKALAAITLSRVLGLIPGEQHGPVTIVGSTTVGGRSAYVLDVEVPQPVIPPGTSAAVRKQYEAQAALIKTPQFIIDKQNGYLLKLVQHVRDRPVIYVFSRQMFNTMISASVFHFTPPRGAKEYMPPAHPSAAPLPGRRPSH